MSNVKITRCEYSNDIRFTREELDAVEVESPCIRARIQRDAFMDIYEREERGLLERQAADSRRHRRMVEIYVDYYAKTEELDRRHPHKPGPHPGWVSPIRPTLEHVSQLRSMLNAREIKIERLYGFNQGVPQHERTQAVNEARDIHARETPPCECTRCWNA